MVMKFFGNLIDKFNSAQSSKQGDENNSAQLALDTIHKTTIDLLYSRIDRLSRELQFLSRTAVSNDPQELMFTRNAYQNVLNSVKADKKAAQLQLQSPEVTITFLQNSATILEKLATCLRDMQPAPASPPSVKTDDDAPDNQAVNTATRRQKLQSMRQSQGLQDATTLTAPKLRFKSKPAATKPTN